MKREAVAAALLSLFASMLLTAAIVQAQQAAVREGPGNVRIGPIEVHGELTQRATYDDNIFIEPDNEVDDVILTTTPTVNFILPGERFNGNAFYSVGLRAFMDNDQENSQDHVLSAALAYITPRGNFFRLEDTYLDTTNLSTSEEQSNIAPRTRWHDNTVAATLGLLEIPNLEKMDLEFSYSYDNRYFDRDENSTEDRDVHELAARWYYDASPFLSKTRWLVEYRYGLIGYDEGILVRRDGDYHIVRAGVSIDPTAKLSGIATAGVQFRNFDYPPDPALGVAETQDLTLTNVRVDLRYRYGVGRRTVGEVGAEAGSMFIAASRDIRETAWRFLDRIKPVVEVTRVDLGLEHRFNFLPLTLFANAFYEFDDFPGVVEVLPGIGVFDEREDDVFGAGLRLRLDGRFPGRNLNLFAEVGYDMENRESNFDHKDYLANRGSILVGANF